MYIRITATTDELCHIAAGLKDQTGLQLRLYLQKRSRLMDGSAVALLRVDRHQDKMKLIEQLTLPRAKE